MIEFLSHRSTNDMVPQLVSSQMPEYPHSNPYMLAQDSNSTASSAVEPGAAASKPDDDFGGLTNDYTVLLGSNGEASTAAAVNPSAAVREDPFGGITSDYTVLLGSGGQLVDVPTDARQFGRVSLIHRFSPQF